VSYSHLDEAAIYHEIRWLQDQGINIWYDSRIRPGSEWSDAIANAIEGCSRMVDTHREGGFDDYLMRDSAQRAIALDPSINEA